ncbi:hypothetical protein [Halapricum hydrolyticum]|uniref:Uncharacterized protein n=1 Tax=Halapricum hydrolyticum TaxID=2979991 RepID=A0AAE3LDW6_9EURY|nr:hypothetical protein [Halapricum hydrolyticum]MCU4716709.1 hypothetical protein [Halapricum hydrolyticum]MCU4725686.1 hypothetical protein [Halapricum hydrolyticum]
MSSTPDRPLDGAQPRRRIVAKTEADPSLATSRTPGVAVRVM